MNSEPDVEGWAAVADLYHRYLTGLMLALVVRQGTGRATEVAFRTFRRQHLEKFLPGLAKLANALVAEALEAYRLRDADRSLAVRGRDAELDAEYTGLFRELLTYMAEDPRQITACTHLLFMAKNIERIGDHATNIAENTWFLVHGEQPAGEREKRDLTAQ